MFRLDKMKAANMTNNQKIAEAESLILGIVEALQSETGINILALDLEAVKHAGATANKVTKVIVNQGIDLERVAAELGNTEHELT